MITDLSVSTSRNEIPLPVREEIAIRPAVAGDLAFIDSLQRMHSDRVGWMQTKALETKIEKGEIIVAEVGGRAVGYCMGQDRYFKRDDVGIIYQMNIEPGHQRGLVGATLLKAMFDRAAWGCKLFCCWCAQDLAANKFWEAMGFVPLAFRAGSEKKAKGGRVHIFWQKRIRSGDVTTPYWFPSQTGAGALKEDRLVLPIPPGTHWSEVRGTVLPTEKFAVGSGQLAEKDRQKKAASPEQGRREKKSSGSVVVAAGGGLWYKPKKGACPEQGRREKQKAACPERSRGEKVKEPKKRRKNDPKLVAAARELRDRWLEQVNSAGGENLLVGCGKYDVSRALGEASVVEIPQVKQITAIAA